MKNNTTKKTTAKKTVAKKTAAVKTTAVKTATAPVVPVVMLQENLQEACGAAAHINRLLDVIIEKVAGVYDTEKIAREHFMKELGACAQPSVIPQQIATFIANVEKELAETELWDVGIPPVFIEHDNCSAKVAFVRVVYKENAVPAVATPSEPDYGDQALQFVDEPDEAEPIE